MTPSSASSPTSVLCARLEEDGYLLLRGLLPREEVLRAREVIADDLRKGGFVDEGTDKDNEGGLRIKAGTEDPGPKLLARQDLACHPDVLNVLEHRSLRALMARLLSPSPTTKTHPYKWLRAVPTSLHTGPHLDSTYFPSSQYPSLLTAWIPLGDLSPSLGTIVVATSSSLSLAPVELGSDGTRSGWIEGVEGLETGWVTEWVRMGDVVVIGRERVHCSSVNVEGEWRLSCDTRWMGSGVEEQEGERKEGESGSEEDGSDAYEDRSSEEDDPSGEEEGDAVQMGEGNSSR